MMIDKLPSHLRERIAVVDGCWLWTGRIKPNGYGSYGQQRAHRLVYVALNGEVPIGKELGHTCDNRHCVIHVRPVTHLDNVREGRAGSPEVREKISATKRSKLSKGEDR